MKSRMGGIIKDIVVLFLLRMKLIFKDITTVAVLIISVIIFAFMIRLVTTQTKELSSIPVGIVDLDNSNSSRQLISGLKKSTTIRIMERSVYELKKLILDEMVYSVVVIEKGYEDRLKSGDLDNIITIYYKKNNTSATLISDVVAGEIIYPASLYKSFRYYEKAPFKGQKLPFDKYRDYMNNLISSSNDFDFAFHMIYANPHNAVSIKKTLPNSVLYNQLVFGILGILIAFVGLFILSQTVKEKELGVNLRFRISRFGILKRDCANLCAMLFVEGVISIIFTWLVFWQLPAKNSGLWFSAYLLLLLNALVLGEVLLLITKLVRRMLQYQVLCSIIILFFSGMGFYSLVNGFYQGNSDNIIKFIPNSWFIMGFTDIIVYGEEGGPLKTGHFMLLLMAAIFIILVIGIDLIQGFHNKINKNRMVI